LGGVYTSPYQISVNGVTESLVCDDFETDISISDEWLADVGSLSGVGPAGPQKFTQASTPAVLIPNGTTDFYTIQQDYDAAAWLAIWLLYPAVPLAPEVAEDYSYAIWQIFDPGAVNGYNGQALGTEDRSNVATDMTKAFAAGAPPSSYAVTIYTPIPPPPTSPYIYPSQEFIGVSVPEGPALPFLPFDMLALFGGVFLVRRRILAS
jgi:hypothetical protein